MNALVVGAGSVGHVFARHLHLGGSKVSFFAREEHARRILHGLVLFHLNKRNARMRPIRFGSFDVMTRFSQLDKHSWDQIYICVPSNDLSDTMLNGLKRNSGGATIIKIQPGLADRSTFTSHFEESVLVAGMISFVSYRAPLSGENVAEPGTAYWFPPLLSTLFSGPGDRVQEVVNALDRGGLPAKAHSNVESLVGYMLAVQAPLTAGLECAGWSLRQLTNSNWMNVACRATKEASEVVAKYQRSDPPRILRALNCSIIRLALSLLPKKNPFHLESYLAVHYTKLREQSRQHIDDYIEQGIKHGMSVESLTELRRGLSKSDMVA
jgi:2-dehydropantoate 2-reductase